LDITRELAGLLPVPVIASGGGGLPEHFADILGPGKADAALAASIFHYGEITIPELKGYLQTRGVAVRI
jgi:cyclase